MVDGDATLNVRIYGIPPISIYFRRVRWHQFTQLYSCDVSLIEQAYFRLVDVASAERLDSYIRTDSASIKPYKDLHHFRIFLDETGCHEVFAESAELLP